MQNSTESEGDEYTRIKQKIRGKDQKLTKEIMYEYCMLISKCVRDFLSIILPTHAAAIRR